MLDSQKILEDIVNLAAIALKGYQPAVARQVTFGDWLTEWYETYKKPNIKTHKQIEIAIRLHISPALKLITLEDLRAPKIQAAINAVKTSRNRETVYNVYTEALRMARVVGYTKNDPMLGVLRPKHRRKKGRALTEEEQAELLMLLSDHAEILPYCVHLLLTGSRPGEPLRLLWSDIDERHGRLHIRGTKTYCADRYIPLFDAILTNLANVPRQGDRVFPYGYDYYEAHFTALNFHGHTLKNLRHTFATRALEYGISMKTVQLWLGHSTYEQTANTYSHVLPKFEASEAAKFKMLL